MNNKNLIKETNGITLIALIITVIILLILAGVAINIAVNGGDLFGKSQNAVSGYNAKAAKEENAVKTVLDYIDEYSEIINTKDPAVEYGYKDSENIIEASKLIPGDIINYYYDKAIEPIECVVIHNDQTHGLQVITLDSVREVTLGCDSSGTVVDPKAEEAFADGAPNGYDDSADIINFEKSRWSYNHAIATLNGYAQEYLGDMAINVRCAGALVDNIITEENESTNMYNDFDDMDSNLNNKFKNYDEYVDNMESSYYEDLRQMDSLRVIQTTNYSSYWLANRGSLGTVGYLFR